MAKTISIRFGADGKIKGITPGAGPLAHAVAGLMEQQNLANMAKNKEVEDATSIGKGRRKLRGRGIKKGG